MQTAKENQGLNNLTPVPQDFFESLLPSLTLAEVRVYLYLYSKFYKMGSASGVVSIGEMTEAFNTSRMGILRGINSLDDKGYITREKRQSPSEGYLSSRYTIPLLERNLL